MTLDKHACLIMIAPDGRVLMQRSNAGASTPDYSRNWKATIMNKVEGPMGIIDTLNYFSKISLNVDFLAECEERPRLLYSFQPSNLMIINIYALKFHKRLVISPHLTDIRLASFERLRAENVNRSWDFFHRMNDVIDLVYNMSPKELKDET